MSIVIRFPIAVLALFVASTAATPVAAQASKVHRVGYLQTASAEEQAHLTRAFEDSMRELGHVEGRNVVYERRFADGDTRRLPALAAELVALKVDVIVTGANPVIDAVKKATSSIPVVMAASRDPVGSGYIANFARPGGNITGVTSAPTVESIGKALEIFREAVPQAKRIALLWNPTPSDATASRKAAEAAAQRMGTVLLVVEVRARDELEAAFDAMVRQRAEGVWVLPDPLTFTARSRVAALALKHRLPSVYWQREFVDAGGLVAYGASVPEQFRRAAGYVDQILKGAKPAELAIYQPTTFELVVNVKTANALGLTIPQPLLQRAADVLR
ncbi:MAG: ABC transporter substrate-binding protein [Betaproteobacteria bacterium]|jgi:putative ABC transport system substrate-binding protein|nr:ABC transporter substrate-binding protein [Betaproteobacteria bacterium]MDH5286619.1 ABC transporter substrate-binding protein [Betaproteobacteria bacterium]